MPLDEAVEQAIGECIREGILAEFLRHNRAEVYQMSIFEYDKEEEEKKLRKAEYEYGYEEGKEAGIKVGMKDGMAAGIEAGRMEGQQEERNRWLLLLSRMTAGGDTEQIPLLNNPEVLKEMEQKYGIE